MLLPHQIQQKPFKKLLNFWSCAQQKAVLVRQYGPALKFSWGNGVRPKIVWQQEIKARAALHSRGLLGYH